MRSTVASWTLRASSPLTMSTYFACPESIIELASAPYGLNMQKAVKLGLRVCVESGLPGRYAPLDAGEALFDALITAMTKREGNAK